jgi:hypothetical protein
MNKSGRNNGKPKCGKDPARDGVESGKTQGLETLVISPK